MSDRRTSLSKAGRILKIVLNLLLAIPALGLGVMTLFSPYVPAGALSENAIVGIALLGTAAILFFDLYKPFLGGVLLIAWAVVFAAVFNGFHLSEYVFSTRQVGYQTFWSGITVLLLVLGLFSLVRAKFGQNTHESA